MTCKICIQFEEAAAAAQKPDTPLLLLGLNEGRVAQSCPAEKRTATEGGIRY